MLNHLNTYSHQIIGAALQVHSTLGPGLLESSYEACLEYELQKRGLDVKRQVEIPISYDKITINCGYRIDLLIQNSIILEIKSVEKLIPVHDAQLLTYLKLSKMSLGLLINFNSLQLKEGIKRIVNKFSEPSSTSSLCDPRRPLR